MIVLQGDRLKNYIDGADIVAYKKRDCYNQYMEKLKSNDKRVICLYGLRRTGKTTMIDQSILEINDYPDCLRLICDIDDNMSDIIAHIEECNCKYIFIDEITKVNNFINTGSSLYDLFSYAGKKIVLAGTDSLGFYLASNDELYDRCVLIHTTYTPFKEWARVLGKSYDEYLQYGGTMTDGSVFYNKGDGYLPYINTAIVDNIANSILKWNNRRNYLITRYSIDELSTALRKIIELANRSFTYKTIMNSFESHDIGSLNDLLIKERIKPINVKEIEIHLKESLHINDNVMGIEKKDVNILIEYLKEMDVIVNDEDSTIFTQPGLRYSQLEDTKDVLRVLLLKIGYSISEQKIIFSKLEQDIKGQMTEDIIYTYLKKDNIYADYFVTKYRDEVSGKEIDLLIINKDTRDALAIEIKNSSEKVKNQARFLLDREFCSEIEHNLGININRKAIAYNGNCSSDVEYHINYIRIEDILTDKWMDETYPVRLFDNK